jgi:hypothetical protein
MNSAPRDILVADTVSDILAMGVDVVVASFATPGPPPPVDSNGSAFLTEEDTGEVDDCEVEEVEENDDEDANEKDEADIGMGDDVLREDWAEATSQRPSFRGGRGKGHISDIDISSSEPTPQPDDNWPCSHRDDCCADCQELGDWPKHLDRTKLFKSNDGRYEYLSGTPHWTQRNLCKQCRDPQHCACSYCWGKRMPRDEPTRNSWTTVCPDGVPTLHIPWIASDFQAVRCAGCCLIRPRAPHTPQDRKVCCDCSTHYCSLGCLEKDYARHHAELGCSANKGQAVMIHIKLMASKQKVLEAKEAYSAARFALEKAEQDLAATMLAENKQEAEAKWNETRATFEEHMDDAMAICAGMTNSRGVEVDVEESSFEKERKARINQNQLRMHELVPRLRHSLVGAASGAPAEVAVVAGEEEFKNRSSDDESASENSETDLHQRVQPNRTCKKAKLLADDESESSNEEVSSIEHDNAEAEKEKTKAEQEQAATMEEATQKRKHADTCDPDATY